MTHAPASLAGGAKLFAGQCDFLLSCAEMKTVPASALPEIAFAGRSNVGKSSLVNALTGRKTLAKTSSTPGRTQLLNFFNLADRLMLVDLPGYGYAKAPKDQVAGWNALVMQYLRGRPQLRRVLLLIDARHGVKEKDHEIMLALDDAAVTYQLVLTKRDKIPAKALEAVTESTIKAIAKHQAAHPEVLATSSEKRLGIDALQDSLAALTVS